MLIFFIRSFYATANAMPHMKIEPNKDNSASSYALVYFIPQYSGFI